MKKDLQDAVQELEDAMYQAMAFTRLMTFAATTPQSPTNPFTEDDMENGWLPVGVTALETATLASLTAAHDAVSSAADDLELEGKEERERLLRELQDLRAECGRLKSGNQTAAIGGRRKRVSSERPEGSNLNPDAQPPLRAKAADASEKTEGPLS